MEDFPGRLPEAKQDDKEKKDKKAAKKRPGFNAPLRFLTEEKALDNKPDRKSSVLDDALANMAINKRKSTEEDAKHKPEEAGAQNTETNPAPAVETGEPIVDRTVELPRTDETKNAENDTDETLLDSWTEKKRKPNQLHGGEVVIDLKGDKPVEEHVIPLHQGGAPEAAQAIPLEQSTDASQPRREHQVQAKEASAIVPESEAELQAAGGGEVPPEPPEDTPFTPEPDPEPSRDPTELLPAERAEPAPEDIYSPARLADMAPYAPVSERPATKQDVEDAMYYASKAGQNRGVLTGLLVGGAYEHFKHKRREKRQEKRFKQQSKQLEQAERRFTVGTQTQAKQTAETNARFNIAEKRSEDPLHLEKLLPKTPEQPRPDEHERLTIPEDHRLETSAWHSIEVDAKTGKPVETPSFNYGHEYYQERSKEAAPRDQRRAATGEVALVAAAMGQNGSQSHEDGPTGGSSAIPDASTQGAPTSAQSDKEDKSSSPSSGSSGPLWPWVTALVIIAILLLALLR